MGAILSVNRVTVAHLSLACGHVEELMSAGMTENYAIRSLELFVDSYAKLHHGGSATPHHVSQVALWSRAAKRLKKENPQAKARDFFRVEHGTPRRALARKVLQLHSKGKLTERALNRLVRQHWMLAVITFEEDQRLNRIARSQLYKTPTERWDAAGIKF